MIGAATGPERDKYPYLFVCDQPGCYWRTVHISEEDAERVRDQHLENTCPMATDGSILPDKDERGQHYTKIHLGKSIVEQMWDKLDTVYDNLLNATTHTSTDTLKGRARGIAECIALLSGPYFNDPNEVVREATKRVQIRKGEREWSPTPGYKFNPPPITTEAYRKAQEASKGAPSPATTRKATAKKAEPTLSQEQIDGIKSAVESGMFTPEACADVFKVSLAQVKKVLAS